VLEQVAALAVGRDGDLGPRPLVHLLQLVAARVAGDMDARVLLVSPSLRPEAWEAQQREAHEEYERAKDEALRPLLAVMDEREEYLPLRLQVEQWIDSLKQ
jgi:hypothetical protein